MYISRLYNKTIVRTAWAYPLTLEGVFIDAFCWLNIVRKYIAASESLDEAQPSVQELEVEGTHLRQADISGGSSREIFTSDQLELPECSDKGRALRT